VTENKFFRTDKRVELINLVFKYFEVVLEIDQVLVEGCVGSDFDQSNIFIVSIARKPICVGLHCWVPKPPQRVEDMPPKRALANIPNASDQYEHPSSSKRLLAGCDGKRLFPVSQSKRKTQPCG